jgi:CRP-like cAMP-binding protein
VTRAFDTIEAALGAVRSLREEPSPAGELLADAPLWRAAFTAGTLMRAVAWTGDDQRGDHLRRELLSEDEAERAAAVEELARPLAEGVARRLVEARREAAARAGMPAALADRVRPQLAGSDPYVRAAALYVLSQRGEADEQALSDLIRDDHEVVREAAIVLLLRAKEWGGQAEARLVTVERMIALRSVPLFATLAPEDLATLAQASRERQFTAGEALCVEGEPGDEVFVILSGDATVLRQTASGGKAVGRETAGAVIGELAVLDPGARAATVLAGSRGTRVLCLGGGAFREVLRSNPSVIGGVMRALVGRIRGGRRRARGAAEPNAVRLHEPGS